MKGRNGRARAREKWGCRKKWKNPGGRPVVWEKETSIRQLGWEGEKSRVGALPCSPSFQGFVSSQSYEQPSRYFCYFSLLVWQTDSNYLSPSERKLNKQENTISPYFSVSKILMKCFWNAIRWKDYKCTKWAPTVCCRIRISRLYSQEAQSLQSLPVSVARKYWTKIFFQCLKRRSNQGEI